MASPSSIPALTPSEAVARLCARLDDPWPMPATVVIMAHPDDEILGAGGRLPLLRWAVFVQVTDGSPLDESDARRQGFSNAREYAAARRGELYEALAFAGIGPEQTSELEVPDQQVSLHLAEVSRQIAALLGELQPEVVLTHPYEGGHPDHDATAFAVHAAIALVEREAGRPPVAVEMTSYHNSSTGIETGTFLPGPPGCEETAITLPPTEREMKDNMLGCFRTQQETLQYFRTDVERFRPAPRYDFTRPPHAGKLFYEMYPWGMTGERFRTLARETLDELGLTGPI